MLETELASVAAAGRAAGVTLQSAIARAQETTQGTTPALEEGAQLRADLGAVKEIWRCCQDAMLAKQPTAGGGARPDRSRPGTHTVAAAW